MPWWEPPHQQLSPAKLTRLPLKGEYWLGHGSMLLQSTTPLKPLMPKECFDARLVDALKPGRESGVRRKLDEVPQLWEGVAYLRVDRLRFFQHPTDQLLRA